MPFASLMVCTMGNEVVAKCDGITSTIWIVLAPKQNLILTVLCKEMVIFTSKKGDEWLRTSTMESLKTAS